MDSSDFSGAIIQIEITTELCVLGFERHGDAVSEMFPYVGSRSVESLLFTGPESQPDGAIHFQVQSFEDPQGFQDYRAADAVIRGAGTGMPGVQVPAQHHNFIWLLCPGYLGDDVGNPRRVNEGSGQFQFDFGGQAPLSQAPKPIEVLRAECDRGWRHGCAGEERTRSLGEDDPASAPPISSQYGQNAFFTEEL